MWAQVACDALNAECILQLEYDGYVRAVEVHAVGTTKDNKDVMRVWQVAGGSVSKETTGWKLLRVDEANHAFITDQRSLAPRNGYHRGDPAMRKIRCQL